MQNAILVLEDGKFFYGKPMGKIGVTTGEVCFTTSMTGYQHTITDPSFANQIITFTFPHIGNVGINHNDFERSAIFSKGVILREESANEPAHTSSYSNMQQWLEDNKLVGICKIDTRALTKHLRTFGSMNGVIYSSRDAVNFSEARKHLSDCQLMKGQELSKVVTGIGVDFSKTDEVSEREVSRKKVAIIDFGMKAGIARYLKNVTPIVIPATNNFAEVAMSFNPDGVILSNGPGDPEATAQYAVQEIKKLLERNVAIFGICLGHQILAIALGCRTKKMISGHRGSNHPIYNLNTKKVEISAQNHGFVVDEKTIPEGVEITHRSLFDNTVEGIKLKNKKIFSVQYHPEGSPGPCDSNYLFQEFINNLS